MWQQLFKHTLSETFECAIMAPWFTRAAGGEWFQSSESPSWPPALDLTSAGNHIIGCRRFRLTASFLQQQPRLTSFCVSHWSTGQQTRRTEERVQEKTWCSLGKWSHVLRHNHTMKNFFFKYDKCRVDFCRFNNSNNNNWVKYSAHNGEITAIHTSCHRRHYWGHMVPLGIKTHNSLLSKAAMLTATLQSHWNFSESWLLTLAATGGAI